MTGAPTVLTLLLAECEASDIRLTLAGEDGLTIDAPQNALKPELFERLKANKAILLAMLRPATKAALTLPVAMRDTPAKPAKAVCRCGGTNWRDVVLRHSPHNGTTIRRDCGRCGRFIDFPIWYGKYTGQKGQ